ncbi:MAG: hypothetical protein ABJN84_12845 [Flavobacteriaceae bacterium]
MSKISLQDLIDEKAILTRKLGLLNLMITAYSEEHKVLVYDSPSQFGTVNPEIQEVPYDNFPYHKKWIEQLVFLLNQKDRFLSNQEFAEALLPYYREYNIDKLKRKVSVNISAAYINNVVGGLTKIKVTTLPKSTVWGYKKWLDPEGEVLEKHEPFGFSKSM